ncbi:MAG: hypothetical protein BGO42_01205 [Flavobacterium sp. 40-81]|nr:MAG: hypothetical protein ABS44_19735 [Chryseobacterium sp. SCN 40-13]OJV72011.1 MAG: hypothetical protein BGO42_01205 [Flavobacterium sp. 40-81]
MAFDILKISKIQTAHKEATIPISATKLLPSKRFEKSKRVTLKMINPIAAAISMYEKIFIVIKKKNYE